MKQKFNPNTIQLIIGLGNPDDCYRETFHNAGMLLADFLVTKGKKPRFKKISSKHFVVNKEGGTPVIKPSTFMNESGNAVREALSYFKARPEQLLICHDDSDLPLGTFKLDIGRGSAGHKGVASAIQSLGTSDFWRMRIGVRVPDKDIVRRKKAEEFVLLPLSQNERGTLQKTFHAIEKEIFPAGHQ